MDEVESTKKHFRDIYLSGIPQLIGRQETAFLSFLCCVAATDALANYSAIGGKDGDRFIAFVRNYFDDAYVDHAECLWVFRCRMLHNFSPAHFTVTHVDPSRHLKWNGHDHWLHDARFFDDVRDATERFFSATNEVQAIRDNMRARLRDMGRGGGIFVM